MDAVRYMPSLVSVKRVAAAAERKGVSREVLIAMQQAVSEYDAAGKQYADGRASFTSMITSLRNDEAAEAFSQQVRRSAFRDNCQLWGSQVGLFMNQGVIRRNSSGEIDCVAISVKTDFRKLRADALPILYGYSQRSKDGKLIPADRDPIDAKAYAEYGVPLLPEFCSKPLPSFGSPEIKDGWTVHRIQGDQIGKLSSIDLVTAYRFRDPGLVEMSDGRKIFFLSLAFRVPTETAIIEMLIHRPTMGLISPRLRIIAEVGTDFVTELENPQPLLQSFETVQYLGDLETSPPVSEYRHYSRMTTFILDKLHLPQSDFDVYRVSIAYPMLHTLAVLWFDAPAATESEL